jgi:hypothetical protein
VPKLLTLVCNHMAYYKWVLFRVITISMWFPLCLKNACGRRLLVVQQIVCIRTEGLQATIYQQKALDRYQRAAYDGGGLGQCSYCLTVSSCGSQIQWTSPWCWSHSGLSSHSVSIFYSKKCYLLIYGVIYNQFFVLQCVYILLTQVLVSYIHGWHWIAKACGCVGADRWIICCESQPIGELVPNLVVWRIQSFWSRASYAVWSPILGICVIMSNTFFPCHIELKSWKCFRMQQHG